MPDFAGALGASKAAAALLVLLIPSKDRRNKAIDQRFWVEEALNVLGALFGGATAFPKSRASGVTTPGAANFYLTSRWSSNATQASICLSRSCPRCGTFSTGWGARRGRERLGCCLERLTIALRTPDTNPKRKRGDRWRNPR
jgi:hypothetical protein